MSGGERALAAFWIIMGFLFTMIEQPQAAITCYGVGTILFAVWDKDKP